MFLDYVTLFCASLEEVGLIFRAENARVFDILLFIIISIFKKEVNT